MLVDDMNTRKELWEAHVKFNPKVKFMIEARMGTHHGQIFTIKPLDMDDINMWESLWFPNEDVVEDVTACGASQTMCPTASIMAGYMAWQFVQAMNDEEYNRNFTLNLGAVPLVV